MNAPTPAPRSVSTDVLRLEFHGATITVYTGPVLTNHQLLQQVWGPDKTGGSGSVRDIIKRLRRKLGDDANNPAYILNEPRVGYWMEKGETQGLGEP